MSVKGEPSNVQARERDLTRQAWETRDRVLSIESRAGREESLAKGVRMHVTIRRYSGSPELADALVARESEVREIITGIGGFQAYYLIRGADGEATSITAYDSESGAEESNRRAAEWLRENLPDLSVSPPEVTAGEAVISF